MLPRQARPRAKAPRVVTHESKLERETRSILEELFGVPFKKRRPDFLENPVTGCNLELDCYNKDLKLGVEVNGRQHYQFIPFFHKTHEKFRLQQYKDELKKRMCKDNGVEIISVPYNVKNTRKFLIDEISKIPHLRETLIKSKKNIL